jgi:hypothetical protein
MEAVRWPQRLGRENGSPSSQGMNPVSLYSAIRRPAQMPATAPRPLKSSDWSEKELAPQRTGTKPPANIPAPAHMPMTERPMGN